MSNGSGTTFNASSALLASLIVSASILITKGFSGKYYVNPIPAKDVDAIPTADVALPTCLYFSFSPVT